jgi:hypothetical protein
MNPATLITVTNAAIQTTKPIMHSSHSTQINTAAFQTSNTIKNPVTLHTLPTAANQNNNPPHAVQSFYPH